MRYFIYALIDPNTNQIRYIGKTYNIKKRLTNHLLPSQLVKNTRKNNWLKKLLKSKQFPILKILCKCKLKNVNKLEKKYITYYQNLGYNLTNGTKGGDGWPIGQKMPLTDKRLNSYRLRMKKVIARSLKTGKETIYDSITECAKAIKTAPSTVIVILKQLKGKKTVKGYHIRYFGTEFQKPILYGRIYKVKRTCIKTGKIKIYEDITKVQNDGFSKKAVRDVCVKYANRTQHKGYRWEYAK